MKFEDGPPSDAAVAQCLAAVKRDGGSVLVVGAARRAQAATCEEFQSGDTEGIVVRTDGTVRNDRGDDEPAVLLDRPVPTRSTSSVTSTSSGPTDVRSIREDICSEMVALADEAQVSVCFDSLRPYVDGPDQSTLIAAMEELREVARETDAVVHFHLPAMPEAIPAPLFDAVDAVVRVLQQGETTYQQWQLPDEGVTTDWVTR